MIKYISTATFMLDFDVVGLKTKLEFESVVVLLTLSCPTSLGSALVCGADEIEGVPYMLFYHHHLWYLTNQN